MDINIDVSELNRLAVDVARLPVKVQMKAPMIVRKVASEIEATAKTFCPVDTGFLRSSIHIDMIGQTTAVVSPSAGYAEYVEFGTARMAPRAFMGPAADRHGWELAKAFETLVDGLQ